MNLVMWLKIAAEIVTGLYTVFLLYLGIDDTIRGDFHLIGQSMLALILLGFFMWRAWKYPRAGICLVIFALVFLISRIAYQRLDAASIIIGGPPLLAGLLFFLAAGKTPKAPV